ncbi:MAG: hypothetical protein ACE5F9_14620 [Phycisphaerae bacterium]
MLLVSSGGCFKAMSAWAAIAGGNWIEPEYKLTDGPLLILVDDLNNQISEPGPVRKLHKTLSDIFLEYDVNKRVIPLDSWKELRQSDKDYDKLAVRQIGEKLGAEQILYLDVVRFTLYGEPGADIFKGQFTVRVKVLSTRQQRDVRLWPRQESGKRVVVSMPPEPNDGDRSASVVAKELSEKLGHEVAKLFYGHRELDD